MAFDTLRNVKIMGISTAVPKKIITSGAYNSKIGKDSVDKFVKTVGIGQRHVGDGKVTASDLCAAAAENLIDKLHVERKSIDALLFVSQTPDYIAPATACVLQHRLGLSDESLCFDINLGCSGYVYGLHTAMIHLQSGCLHRVLLLAGDTASYAVSPEDRANMMLFGDAGTATLLEYDETAPRSSFYLKTVGAGFRNLLIPYGGYRHWNGSYERKVRKDESIRSDYDCYMNGAEVFKFSITEVPAAVRTFFEKSGLELKDFDRVVFHQGNMMMIKNIAKRLCMDADKLAFSIEDYGNTASASIPLTLCHHWSKDFEDSKKRILIAGYGIGLSLGVAEIQLNPGICFPIIEVGNEVYYEDEIKGLL